MAKDENSRTRYLFSGLCTTPLILVVVLSFGLILLSNPSRSIGYLENAMQSSIRPAGAPDAHRSRSHFRFNAPSRYFLPSLSTTDPASFDPATTNFGLISQPYPSDSTLDIINATDWQRFVHLLHTWNSAAAQGTTYKLLFLSRHGQGYHNLAESYYGTPAWDCHYAALPGDPLSDIRWIDARLSKLGERQAAAQGTFWRDQLSVKKMPTPQAWYASPMERACRTAQITFEPLNDELRLNFVPLIKEKLREENGIHTCDQRSSRSIIAARYPNFRIEDGFTEHDDLYDPIYRETHQAHTARVLELLDDIFTSSYGRAADVLSMVAHGGAINAILRAVGHREFQVNVGSAIAVFVQAEEVAGARPEYRGSRGATIPQCIDDPLKAGRPGYKSFKEYVDEIEAAV